MSVVSEENQKISQIPSNSEQSNSTDNHSNVQLMTHFRELKPTKYWPALSQFHVTSHIYCELCHGLKGISSIEEWIIHVKTPHNIPCLHPTCGRTFIRENDRLIHDKICLEEQLLIPKGKEKKPNAKSKVKRKSIKKITKFDDTLQCPYIEIDGECKAAHKQNHYAIKSRINARIITGVNVSPLLSPTAPIIDTIIDTSVTNVIDTSVTETTSSNHSNTDRITTEANDEMVSTEQSKSPSITNENINDVSITELTTVETTEVKSSVENDTSLPSTKTDDTAQLTSSEEQNLETVEEEACMQPPPAKRRRIE